MSHSGIKIGNKSIEMEEESEEKVVEGGGRNNENKDDKGSLEHRQPSPFLAFTWPWSKHEDKIISGGSLTPPSASHENDSVRENSDEILEQNLGASPFQMPPNEENVHHQQVLERESSKPRLSESGFFTLWSRSWLDLNHDKSEAADEASIDKPAKENAEGSSATNETTNKPAKKPLLGINWPWSSEKSSNRDQEQPAPSQRTKSRSSLHLKWPWSSEDDKKTKDDPQDSTSSKHFSDQVAAFARKTLPGKLLAITPWAEKKTKEVEKKRKHSEHETVIPVSPTRKQVSLMSVDSDNDGHEHKRRKRHRRKTNLMSKSKQEIVFFHSDDDFLSSAYSSTLDLDDANMDDGKMHIDDPRLLNVSIPDNLAAPPPRKPVESNWGTVYNQLTTLAQGDPRYEPRMIEVFGAKEDNSDLSSESSEGGSRVTSVMSLSSSPALAADIERTSPFLYHHRPFRMPKLATHDNAWDSGTSTPRPFKFDPIRVDSDVWSNIYSGNEAYMAVSKWAFPEPIREDKRLLPEVDPLVRYKLKLRGKNRVAPSELITTQNEIAVGISPSGRKLDDYSSASGDECAFRQMLCKNDPDFDIVQPYIETESGEKWPNPFLFYWNWKKVDKDVDEEYLRNQSFDKKSNLISQKRRVALELVNNPMKIPYQDLGADDTDYEDPLGPLSAIAATVLDKFNYLSITSQYRLKQGSGEGEEDPVTRRYPYLLLHHYSSIYKNFHQLKLLHRAQGRRFYEMYRGILGKYTSTCVTISMYPVWFYIWKRSIRYLIRRLPRRYKFCNERKAKTVFYGSLASLYGTQYISEYDLLPNMDDPVHLSQVALEKALEIKEEFYTYSKSGTGPPYVDYVKMQRSTKYEKYLECIGLLCRFQPIKMPPRVRKVFFINYFNVLSIQTQILRIPEKENTKYLWEIKNFWEKTKGLAGFLELSLEEIYHGILRCNRIHPVKQVRVFEKNRVKAFAKEMCPTRLSLDWMDPRIHFALSIGCKSCPPIHSFSLYEHECQLDEVAKTYVRKHVTINLQRRLVTLPILFLWYEKDFGHNKYLKQFMLSKDILKVRHLLTKNKPIKFRYERFDYEIDHEVRRHPASKCEPPIHKKIIPTYWGSKV